MNMLNKLTILCMLSIGCFFNAAAQAKIPSINEYRVEKLSFSAEPQFQQFTISAKDESTLIKPSIFFHTQLNLLDTSAIYTIRPYPHVDSLPQISKWMLFKLINSLAVYNLPKAQKKRPHVINYIPAHWINITNGRGQYIIEAINYAFVVYGNSGADAKEKLLHAIHKAQFFKNKGTSFYYAYIGGRLFPQSTVKGQPAVYASDKDYRHQRDHFRIFGPYPFTINKHWAYLFISSVSEETGIWYKLAPKSHAEIKTYYQALLKKKRGTPLHQAFLHHYVSFSHSRNNLAVRLIQSGYPTYYAMGSNVLNTLGETTEDHDGKVYITIIK